MEQIKLLWVVDDYLQAFSGEVCLGKFNVHILYMYWCWGEKSQLYEGTWGKMSGFFYQTFKYNGYFFVCSFIHTDLEERKRDDYNIKKDFAVRAIYISVASLGYGMHWSLLWYFLEVFQKSFRSLFICVRTFWWMIWYSNYALFQ